MTSTTPDPSVMRHSTSASRIPPLTLVAASLLFGVCLTLGCAVFGFARSFSNAKTALYPFSRRLSPDALIYSVPGTTVVWRLERSLSYSVFEAAGRADYFGIPPQPSQPSESRQLPTPPPWAGLEAVPNLGIRSAMRTSAVGLPMRCFIAVAEILPGDRPIVRWGRDPSRDPWPWARDSSLIAIDQVVAPTHVLWAPLLINLAAWSASGAVLLSTPRLAMVIRSSYRRRRGQCAACGYDLRGLERCPECGRDSPARRPNPPAGILPSR